MAQFDVFRNARSRRYPLVIDLQADLLQDLASHVVAPLTPLGRLAGTPISRLNPVVTVDGTECAILFQELAAYPVQRVGPAVANFQSARVELIAALDLLSTGV